jgi:hypothetical protein
MPRVNKNFTTPLLPMLPLWEYCEMDNDSTVGLFAERINCERKSVYRWFESGGIPLIRAEAISDYLGIHPTSVWGKEYFFACHEEEERKKEMSRIKARKYKASIKKEKNVLSG